MIFVFGSNLAGRHGAGAAKFAVKNHGAVYGQGWGLQGNSFAIPTKDAKIKTLPLFYIRIYVDEFKIFAEEHPELTFQLTPIGCGLAGYTYEDIGPMFKNSPSNIVIPKEFEPYV
jgi:hypothetical protein